MYKRKRSYSKSGPTRYAPRRRTYTTRRPGQLVRRPAQYRTGFSRTSGNYRFQGARGRELKWKDTFTLDTGTGFDNVPVTVNGTVIYPSINLLTSGTGESQVIGRNINIKRIQIRGIVTFDAVKNANINLVPEDMWVRFLLVLDTQANGEAFTVDDVLQDPAGAAPLSVLTYNNLSNSKRFRILKECVVSCHRDTSWDGTDYVVGVSELEFPPTYLKAGIPVEYGATPSSAITDVKTNNVGLIGLASNSLGVVRVTMQTRIRYSDS